MIRKFKKVISLTTFFLLNRILILLMPLNEKAVVFLTDARDNLEGNLKTFYNFLSDKKSFDLFVFCRGDRRQKNGLLRFWEISKAMASCKYMILDDFYGYTSVTKLRKHQELIQLWHGSGAFKKFGYSREISNEGKKRIHSGYKKYTFVSVSSEAVIGCYAEAFGLDYDKIKAFGIPRTDSFFDIKKIDDIKKRLQEEYPILNDKKLILIAPTYRGSRVEDAYYDFSSLNLDRLSDEFRNSYIIGIKWHPALVNNIRNGKIKFELPANVIDFSEYDEINDLLLATDILVTDYSSTIFEYCLLDKPIIYFVPDLDEYKGDRGFYYSWEDYVYGDVAKDESTLIKAIKEANIHHDKREFFRKKFMSACDGNSCTRIFRFLFTGRAN